MYTRACAQGRKREREREREREVETERETEREKEKRRGSHMLHVFIYSSAYPSTCCVSFRAFLHARMLVVCVVLLKPVNSPETQDQLHLAETYNMHAAAGMPVAEPGG